LCCALLLPPPSPPLFPYTTLFRSPRNWLRLIFSPVVPSSVKSGTCSPTSRAVAPGAPLTTLASSTPNHKMLFRRLVTIPICPSRSEEHTSELQSLTNLVCPLLLEH